MSKVDRAEASGGSKPDRRTRFARTVRDKRWIEFFYLNEDVEELAGKLASLEFELVPNSRDVPFNAQVRGYQGARDPEGELWLLKEVSDEEALAYKQCEIAYYVDFLLETLSAPTLLIQRDSRYYRATKVIVEAVQIGSCNYLEEPFRKIMANDLINRWVMFDEDRNPNNYMVIHRADGTPLVVAIDFNKADFFADEMKITGNPNQFGWFRSEKTRFLTLLKPENFGRYTIEDFEERLRRLHRLTAARLKRICKAVLEPVVPDPQALARMIARNIVMRRKYVEEYFLTWFKPKNLEEVERKHSEYAGLGKNFVDIYEKKI